MYYLVHTACVGVLAGNRSGDERLAMDGGNCSPAPPSPPLPAPSADVPPTPPPTRHTSWFNQRTRYSERGHFYGSANYTDQIPRALLLPLADNNQLIVECYFTCPALSAARPVCMAGRVAGDAGRAVGRPRPPFPGPRSPIRLDHGSSREVPGRSTPVILLCGFQSFRFLGGIKAKVICYRSDVPGSSLDEAEGGDGEGRGGGSYKAS